jgi:hypothetical protein
MAKIIEEIVVIKFSSIVKDTDADSESTVTNDQIASIIMVAQELVGDRVVIEVERA